MSKDQPSHTKGMREQLSAIPHMSGTKCSLSAVPDSQEHANSLTLGLQHSGAMQYSQVMCL